MQSPRLSADPGLAFLAWELPGTIAGAIPSPEQ